MIFEIENPTNEEKKIIEQSEFIRVPDNLIIKVKEKLYEAYPENKPCRECPIYNKACSRIYIISGKDLMPTCELISYRGFLEIKNNVRKLKILLEKNYYELKMVKKTK